MRSTLSSPALRRILTAYTINRLGSWVGLVALSLAVFDHTHSALAVAGLLLCWQALPAFVVPPLVARVEASSRHSVLSGLYFFEAAATAGLAVLLWHFWLPAVMLVAALDGTAALAASGLIRTAMAREARERAGHASDEASPAPALEAHDGLQHEAPPGQSADDEVHNANAALNLAFTATFVLGPVLGGAIVASSGASAALFIDVASFLVCGALLIGLRAHVDEDAGDSVRARLRVAMQHVRQTPVLRALLIADAVALVFFLSAGPIEVAYAKATLHAGDRGYGLLLTMWGVGAVLGGVVFARLLRQPNAGVLGASALAIGLAYAGFAGAPSLALACVAALVGGTGNGVEIPTMISVVQRMSPQRLHGRLIAGVESLSAVSLAVGLALGGALVAISSPRTAFVAIAVGTAATACALLRIWRDAPLAGEGTQEMPSRPADAPGRTGTPGPVGPRSSD